MEDWEIDLRRYLEKDVCEGLYSILIDGKKYLTGKQGVIDQMVDIARDTLEKEKK